MKQRALILSGFLATLTASVHGQGQLELSNLSNSSTNFLATENGLFWLSMGGATVLINQDFNASFYLGTNSSSLSPIATILLSDGTAAGDNNGGPGTFAEPSGKTYTLVLLGGRTRFALPFFSDKWYYECHEE